MRKENIPLFALESQDPIKDFDFLGITIQYEMCYTNILQVLDLAGIPLLATERGEDCPIVIGGGPCTYNPEPIADFFDIFYIGEGETQYRPLIDLYKKCRTEKTGREEFLRRAAKLPGMYVPRFYETTYHENGTIASFQPTEEGIPARIRKESGNGYDRQLLSYEAGSSLYQSHTGQSRSGDSERLYPWLSFLSGRTAVSSRQRKGCGSSEKVRHGNVEKHRS